MSDYQSAGIAGEIFDLLAKNFKRQPDAVKRDRKRLAAKIYTFFSSCDFNDDQMSAYDALVTLGLAKKCKLCGEGYTGWSEDAHGAGECTDDHSDTDSDSDPDDD